MDTSSSPSSAGTEQDLLADRFAPRPDITQARHLVVDADVATTYAAARQVDFADVHGAFVDAAKWLRGLPQRWKNRRGGESAAPTRLRFDDMAAGSGWVLLGERPGAEIAAGAVGRFWSPAVEWRHVGADDFGGFSEPGNGKIVLSLSVRRYGSYRTLLSYDIRVTFTDPGSGGRFRMLWPVLSRAVKVIQDSTLRTIAHSAEQTAAGQAAATR